jgi:outer membrane lipoprotein SlyB
MKYKNIVCGIIGLIGCFLLTNCNKDIPPGDYDSAEVGKIKKVVPGTIISMRPVRLHSKNDDNLTVQTGTAMSNSYNRSHGYEYVIRLNSGGIISVVQAENIKLKNKQHILVIYGANTRVVADHGSEAY